MDIERLKQKILDLAIRGKLVPQNPNDEPASVLVDKIRAEKEELIRQGKIKRSKDDSYIFKGSDNCYYEKINGITKNITEEIPFDIPDNWTWTRLKNIITMKSGDAIKVTRLLQDQEYPVYGGNGINGSYSKYNVPPKTIIIGRVGFYCGSIHVTEKNAWITDNALIVEHNHNIDVELLSVFLETLKLSKTSNSTAQPVVSNKGILPLLCPIPPINEQKNIVKIYKKIQKVILNMKNDISELNDVIHLTKLAILDYYFGENSCYKSYYKINTRLIDILPPELVGDGDWVLSEDMDENGTIDLIQLKHIGNLEYQYKPYNHVNKEFTDNNNCSFIKSGYLLINRLISDSLKCCILPKIGNDCITAVDVCWVAPNNIMENEYLMYLLTSPTMQRQIKNKSSGSTRKRISKKNLLNIPVNIHTKEIQLKIMKEIRYIFNILNSINS